MIYLNYMTRREKPLHEDRYPFSVPSIKSLEKLEFKSPVTFLTGENGSGKSTVLEAIGAGIDAYALGFSGRVIDDPYLSYAAELARNYYFSRMRYPRIKMFFRAEDVLGYVRALNDERFDDFRYETERQSGSEALDFENVRKSIIRGNEIDSRSHGESFLDLMYERLHGGGLYLLDEPETPLSVSNQIQLIQLLRRVSGDGGQFIVVTHSPILLALPEATIYEFGSEGITEKRYAELTSVRLLKRFLSTPERYLED